MIDMARLDLHNNFTPIFFISARKMRPPLTTPRLWMKHPPGSEGGEERLFQHSVRVIPSLQVGSPVSVWHSGLFISFPPYEHLDKHRGKR